MMRIEIDCTRIRKNTEAVVAMAASAGIDVVGVTKACCGDPDVARAMLAGGLKTLADSRLKHIEKLRKAGIESPVMLLRLPSARDAGRVVCLAQSSLNSELDTIQALSQAAQKVGLTHKVILMIELGDLREGIMPEDSINFASEIINLPGIDLAGIGTNLHCLSGVLPSEEKAEELVSLAIEIEKSLGIHLDVISNGHTSDLELIDRGMMPARVNQVRIGEAILLGVNCNPEYPISLPHQDAFEVIAEVIEVRTKPTKPDGKIGQDAFGRVHRWKDLGPRRRAILAVGEQDLRLEGLRPIRSGITTVGGSSDHLVVDVTNANPVVKLGEEIKFIAKYPAVATAMANLNVTKIIHPAKLSD